MTLRSLPFWLVDVFAREPLSGNGLSVFLLEDDLPARAMQSITREMRQFESIFLQRTGHPTTFRARIFTMEEELPFAGHPVLGAAAVLHSELFSRDDEVNLTFVIHDRRINLTSRREGESYIAEMDQGSAAIAPPVPEHQHGPFLAALNITSEDLAPNLPLQVISTGLAYLIVPVSGGLDRARIVVPDFENLLAAVGAKFVYVLDINRREGRTWENDGSLEDIATGSAAGPVAAYLVAHGRASKGETITLAQGRFVKRPSQLYATVSDDGASGVSIKGRVCSVGNGTLRLPEKCLL